MDENMKKEIENGASVLEITQEDAMAKYEDLRTRTMEKLCCKCKEV